MELREYNVWKWTINSLSICEELCDPSQVPRIQKLMRYMQQTMYRINNPEKAVLPSLPNPAAIAAA